MLTDNQVILLVIGTVASLCIILAMATVKSGSDADDYKRLCRLTDEGRKKFPTLPYKSMIECLRWQAHLDLKTTTDKNSIAELAEDYLVLNDEVERIEKEEEQLGGEFAVFHKTN